MLPRDLYAQPESPWPYSYCGRYGCSAGSFYPVGVIGGEVEAVLEVKGTGSKFLGSVSRFALPLNRRAFHGAV